MIFVSDGFKYKLGQEVYLYSPVNYTYYLKDEILLKVISRSITEWLSEEGEMLYKREYKVTTILLNGKASTGKKYYVWDGSLKLEHELETETERAVRLEAEKAVNP